MIALILATWLSSSAVAGEFKPRLHEIKCKNLKAVTEEAVAYALVGAWEPYTTRACIKGQIFKHFNPRAGQAEGDVYDPSQILFFKKGQDSYSIKSVKAVGSEHEIAVEFKIGGKTLNTVYNYVPDPAYTGRTGICGFVTNSSHTIIRSDCVDQRKWNEILERAKKAKRMASTR